MLLPNLNTKRKGYYTNIFYSYSSCSTCGACALHVVHPLESHFLPLLPHGENPTGSIYGEITHFAEQASGMC